MHPDTIINNPGLVHRNCLKAGSAFLTTTTLASTALLISCLGWSQRRPHTPPLTAHTPSYVYATYSVCILMYMLHTYIHTYVYLCIYCMYTYAYATCSVNPLKQYLLPQHCMWSDSALPLLGLCLCSKLSTPDTSSCPQPSITYKK